MVVLPRFTILSILGFNLCIQLDIYAIATAIVVTLEWYAVTSNNTSFWSKDTWLWDLQTNFTFKQYSQKISSHFLFPVFKNTCT